MVTFCMIDPQNWMVIQQISDDSGAEGSAHDGYVFANVEHAGKPTKAQPHVVMPMASP